MPRYDYTCPAGHVTESVRSVHVTAIQCFCHKTARRVAIYRDQYISCETGPKSGLKVEAPRDEKDLRKPFAQYQEAAQEVEYAYARVDDPKVKAPDLYGEGIRRAKKRGVKMRA